MVDITKSALASYLKVPETDISDEVFNKALEVYASRKSGVVEDLKNKLMQGYYQSRAGISAGLGYPEAAAEFVKKSQEVPRDPLVEKRIEGITSKDNTFSEALGKAIYDPEATASILAQTLPASVMSGIGAAATYVPSARVLKGAPLAAKLVSSGAFGGISGFQEYGQKVLETLAESGVNITDGDQINQVMNDPEIQDWLRKKGLQKGIPVGAFDAVSFGIAGRFLSAKGSKLSGGLKEMGAQAGLGMAGEAGGQLAVDQKITDESAIALEGLLEAVTGVPQAVVQGGLESAIFNGDTNAKASGFNDEIDKFTSKAPQIVGEDIVIEDTGETGIPLGVETKTPLPDTVSEKTKKKVASAEREIPNVAKAETVAPSEYTFPKEVRRGTYKQIRNRLMSLKRSELLKRAKLNDVLTDSDFINEDGTPKLKSEIVDTLLERYGIASDVKKTQTPVTPITKVTERPTSVASEAPATNVIDDKSRTELSSALEDTTLRAALEKLAKQKGRIGDAARAWLGLQNKAAPEAKEALPELPKSVVNTAPANEDGSPIVFPSSVDKAIHILANRQTEGFAAAEDAKKWIKSVLGWSDKKISEEVKAARKVKPKVTPEKKAKAIAPTKSPAAKKAAKKLLQDSSTLEKAVEATNVSDSTGAVGTDTPVKTVVDAYMEKFRREAEPVMEFLGKNSKWEWSPEDYKNAPSATLVGRTMQLWDNIRSMQSMARKYPIIAPLNIMWRDKQTLRHNLSQYAVRKLAILTHNYGVKRIDAALEILDKMSRPGAAPQAVDVQADGTLMFMDLDGRIKRADPSTSKAILDIMDLHKEMLAAKRQAVISDLEPYGISPDTATIENIQKVRDSYLATKNEDHANTLSSAISALEHIDRVIASNRAYYPHVRSEGPYAIATYRKDNDGKLELAGLYDVKATISGAIDKRHQEQVINRIRKDAILNKETFYTIGGGNIASATPFYKTRDSLNSLVQRNATDSKIAYEVVASLLATKGIDPTVVNELFDSLSLRDNIEKVFINLRERKGYYGYNNEDRLSSIANFFLTDASLLANYKFNPQLRRYHASVETELMQQPNGEQLRKSIKDYYDYMTSLSTDGDFIRAFNFWYFLAGNPSTGLLQILSTFTNTLPWLAQYVGTTEFIKANLNSLTGLFTRVRGTYNNRFLLNKETLSQFADKTGVSMEDARILLQLKNEGALDPGYGIEALGDAKVGSFGVTPRGQKRFPKPVRYGIKLASNLITVPEEIARLNTTFLIIDSLKNQDNFEKIGSLLYKTDPLFKKAVDSRYSGKITKEAIIRHAIDENHAVFGKVGRAKFMRSRVGAIAFPFLTYPIQMMEQMGRLMMDRGPEGRRAFAMMALVYPMMFGGLMAVPGYELWDWMTKWYKRLADKEKTNLEIEINKAMAGLGLDASMRRTILSGAIFNDVLEADMSKRISNQFWFQPILDFVANPDGASTGAQDKAYAFLGGIGSALSGAEATAHQISEGDSPIKAILQNAGPVVVRNAMKAEDILSMDIETARGQRVLPRDAEGVGVIESIMQLSGVNPSKLSEARKFRYQQQILNDSFKMATSSFNNQLARHYSNMLYYKRAGDTDNYVKEKEALLATTKELINFNERLPTELKKTRKKLLSDTSKVLRQKVAQDINPLTKKQTIGKSRNAEKDAELLALPYVKKLLGEKE